MSAKKSKLSPGFNTEGKASVELKKPDSRSVQVDLGGMSHCGAVRAANEDCFLVAQCDRGMEVLSTNVPEGFLQGRLGDTVHVMLVADGIGGAPAAKVASRTAIQVLLDLLSDTPDWIMQLTDESAPRVLARTATRFRQIEEAFIAQTQENPTLSGMGTTLTVACIYGSSAVVSHVGHSCAYLFRDGKLKQLTGEHTMAQELLKAGAIREEDVQTHPFRRTLTKAISTNRGNAQAELHIVPLKDGDQLLLCTDGLSSMVREAKIEEMLLKPGMSADTCKSLVDLALAGGGKDDVTVTLARFHTR
jgi:PPM family protein phosphatase